MDNLQLKEAKEYRADVDDDELNDDVNNYDAQIFDTKNAIKMNNAHTMGDELHTLRCKMRTCKNQNNQGINVKHDKMKLLHSMSYSTNFSGFEYYYLFASIQISLYSIRI